MRVADYITKFFLEKKISDVFTVVGGGAMHLNDAFGNSELECTYFLHEQAAAIAAEAYAKYNNTPAVVCVTTGPGGTNAITGVLCAWQDNIPMIVISGQVRYNTTVKSTGRDLRQYGEQEHDIINTVKNMTKYAVMVTEPNEIKYHLEKAIYLATTKRRGPCWIDIPLDVQGAQINEDELLDFEKIEEKEVEFPEEDYKAILSNSKRPVILLGSGVRSSGAHIEIMKLINKLQIPVLSAKSNSDLLCTEDMLNYGNFGVNGGRAGNFIIQNADCLLILGCRLSFGQTGYNTEEFSRKSKKVLVEVDIQEINKKNIKIDLPICMDLLDFAKTANQVNFEMSSVSGEWISFCNMLRTKYSIMQDKFCNSKNVNPYYFAEYIKQYLNDDFIGITGNSCSGVSIKQCGIQKSTQRLWGNTNCGTMGYDIPASIGASIASKRKVICFAGDGSIQMNIQELQTIVSYKLPIKIFVFNNGGYSSIIRSQTNAFHRVCGCTETTGLKLPSMEKIAKAYEIPYVFCSDHIDIQNKMKEFLEYDGYGICEIQEDPDYFIEPKMSNKVLESGQIVSPQFDNLAPFLEDEEYILYSNYFGEDK